MTELYPDRIRYIGALDDDVIRARSSRAEEPSLAYVNTILAQEALFGVPIALNDGHLFHYEAGRQALTDREASPLLDLLERGYVTILSRNGDLSEMPKAMQHVPSYRTLINSPNWRVFHQRLRETQRVLKDGYNLRPWPSVDLGSGFVRLLGLSVREGGAIKTLSLNDVGPDQVHELLGRLEERARGSHGPAARSMWSEICDSAPHLSESAKAALRWLGVETYHHNFAMAMSTVFVGGGVGVVTRCSDIYSFVHESPWVADSRGATPRELPVPRLARAATATLHRGDLLAAVVTPGSRLNRAKTDYLVAITDALEDRSRLPIAREVTNEYSRLLAEQFAKQTKSTAEPLLQIATAAFGAAAGQALDLASGSSAALGAMIGLLAGQGLIAGLVTVVDKYIPVVVQGIRAMSTYVPVQDRRSSGDVDISRRIARGQAFSSVTISERHVSEHSKALPVW